jgi:hypothetical protein
MATLLIKPFSPAVLVPGCVARLFPSSCELPRFADGGLAQCGGDFGSIMIYSGAKLDLSAQISIIRDPAIPPLSRSRPLPRLVY